jgi:hypothetical protein
LALQTDADIERTTDWMDDWLKVQKRFLNNFSITIIVFSQEKLIKFSIHP